MAGTLTVTGAGSGGGTVTPPPAPPPAPGVPGGDTSAGGDHAGHHPAQPAATEAALKRGCKPGASIVLRGTVVSASVKRLTIAVKKTNRAGRAFAKKRTALMLHRKTIFGRVGAPALGGLAAGDSVTAYAGRCRAYRNQLIAARVVLTKKAPVDTGGAGDTGGGTTLKLTADAKGLSRFDKTSLEAPSGKVTLALKNPSPLPHNVSIQGVGVGKQVANGGTSTVSGTLKAGSYTFLCTLPGHAQAGMKGTLTVK
jgi:plastocyanin